LRDLEIITFRHEFERNFDQSLKVLLEYIDVVNYVSLHAPSDLTIAHVDDSQREFAERCLEKIIRVAQEIYCERVVIHGCYHVAEIENKIMVASLRKRAFQKCVKSVKRLVKMGRDFGVLICLENMNARLHLDRLYYMIFGASPYDMVEVAVDVNSPFFKFCFDAAHAYNFCKQMRESREMRTLHSVQELSIPEFFKVISDNVSIIHFSDARGSIAGLKESEHLPLQRGEIDFKALIEVVLECKFDGPIVLETQEEDIDNARNMAKGRKYLEALINSILKTPS